MDVEALTPHQHAAAAGVTRGVKCLCPITSGTSRLRQADGGELQHVEREPQHQRRPSDPGPRGGRRVLRPDLRWRRPHRGRPEGLAPAVCQAGRHLNCIAALDWQKKISLRLMHGFSFFLITIKLSTV